MKSIWKYKIPVSDYITVQMPEGAQILTVDTQRDGVCIWALVDTKHETTPRYLRCFGTGHDASNTDGMRYINTVKLMNDNLIFHFFEQVGKKDE